MRHDIRYDEMRYDTTTSFIQGISGIYQSIYDLSSTAKLFRLKGTVHSWSSFLEERSDYNADEGELKLE